VFTDEDECPGIKRRGGVLNITRHEIELVVDAADIPSEITISLKGLEVGASIHISDVTLPKGAEPAIEDRDFSIATIVPPTVPTAEDEQLEAEVAETQAAEAAEAAAEAESTDADETKDDTAEG
jgi:large subunit ribosomal protein L25